MKEVKALILENKEEITFENIMGNRQSDVLIGDYRVYIMASGDDTITFNMIKLGSPTASCNIELYDFNGGYDLSELLRDKRYSEIDQETNDTLKEILGAFL